MRVYGFATGRLSVKIKSEAPLMVEIRSPKFDHFPHRGFVVDPLSLRCFSTALAAIHLAVGLPTVQVSEWRLP